MPQDQQIRRTDMRLASNSNETVVVDGPVRRRLAGNSNETVVVDDGN
jgi:hypothetical protein